MHIELFSTSIFQCCNSETVSLKLNFHTSLLNFRTYTSIICQEFVGDLMFFDSDQKLPIVDSDPANISS